VLLEEGDDAEGEIERALHEAGFEILPLRKIAPSLEDVFIASVPEKD
jgi:hypothetical protein